MDLWPWSILSASTSRPIQVRLIAAQPIDTVTPWITLHEKSQKDSRGLSWAISM